MEVWKLDPFAMEVLKKSNVFLLTQIKNGSIGYQMVS